MTPDTTLDDTPMEEPIVPVALPEPRQAKKRRAKTETTREVMVRAAHTAVGARVWWAACLVGGVSSTLYLLFDEIKEFETWGQMFAPGFIVPAIGCLMIDAAVVVAGIAGPAPRDVPDALGSALARAQRKVEAGGKRH